MGGGVEEGGEEVIVVVGIEVKGGAVGCVGLGLGEFDVVPGGEVDVPAEAVGVDVEVWVAGVRAACGQICDLDIKVKWSCSLKKSCSSGNRRALEIIVMRAEELLQRYAAGERGFDGVDIGGSDELSRANLSGITLTNAFLNEIFMDRIDLSGANLSGTNFAQSSMARANLRGANLQYVDLRESDFTDAILIDACLTTTTMYDVNLTGANLTNAEVDEDFWIERKVFNNTVMPDGSIRVDNA
jgi:Pentapeptide repeats (8 copies)